MANKLITELYSAKTIAEQWTSDPSNAVAYLGEAFFPANKQMDLDLAWIKGHNGLPISLKPSTFDAKATFRDRIGVSKITTEMPFFREGALLTEKDRRDMLRLQGADDPYALSVLNHIYDDANGLIDGARVVSERMRFQLLAPADGNVGINIASNGVSYVYNYDPDGSWKSSNYTALTTSADKWDAATTCDPLDDLSTAMDAVENKTGTRPDTAIMSLKTFNYLKKAASIRSAILAQNATANIFMTTELAKQFIKTTLGLDVIVYTKKFKKEDGTAAAFMPDDVVTLLTAIPVGETMFSYTPEEVDLASGSAVDTSTVDTGISVTTVQTVDPVNVETIVSEIVLPTFPNMDNVAVLKVV